MKINFRGANLAITALSIGAIAIFVLGFVISQNNQAFPSKTPITISSPASSLYTYSTNELFFRYPASWIRSESNLVMSGEQGIRIVVIEKGSSFVNECMQLDSTENVNNIEIKRFSRVVFGEMCTSTDTSPREIWVNRSGFEGPGIIYYYSSSSATQAEPYFNQILSTFQILD